MSLPMSQVLVFDERLGHSHWVDHMSRARTLHGLVKELRDGVKQGEYVGYRLLHLYWEMRGIGPSPTSADLRIENMLNNRAATY